MESVGVRELGRDARALRARVQTTGLGIEFTDHGRPVARLIPIETGTSPSRDQLVAAGVLRPGRGDPLDVIPVSLPVGSPSSGRLLTELRDDRLVDHRMADAARGYGLPTMSPR